MQMSSVKPSSSSKPSTAGSSRPTQATANPSNGPATKKNCDSKLNRLCVTKADSTEVEFDMTAPPAWSIEAAKTTTVAEDDRFCWLDIQGERQPFWVFWTPDGTMCFHKNASAKLKEGEREECIDNAEIWHKISEDAKKLRAFQGQRRNLLNYVWQVANKRPKGGEQDEEEDHLGTGSEGHVADKKKRLAVEANVLDAEDPVAKKVKPAFE